MICMEEWERSRIAVGFGPFYGMHEKERVRSVCFDSTIEKKIEKKRRFLRRIEDVSSYSRGLFMHMFDEISPLNSLSDAIET